MLSKQRWWRREKLDRLVHFERTPDAVNTSLLDTVSQAMTPLLCTAPRNTITRARTQVTDFLAR